MEKKMFSTDRALKFGWNTVVQNLPLFIGFYLIYFILSFVPVIGNVLIDRFYVGDPFTRITLMVSLYLIGIIVEIAYNMGLIKIALTFYDKKTAVFSDFFASFHLIFNYFAGYILYFFIVLFGTVMLIAPGIYFGIKFSLYDYFIIDKEMGVIKAFNASFEATKGASWSLLGFYLVKSIVNLIGFILCFVGLIISVPITLLASVYVYHALSSQNEAATSSSSPER